MRFVKATTIGDVKLSPAVMGRTWHRDSISYAALVHHLQTALLMTMGNMLFLDNAPARRRSCDNYTSGRVESRLGQRSIDTTLSPSEGEGGLVGLNLWRAAWRRSR